MTTYSLALIGFGGVNRALAELIRDEPGRFASLGFDLRVVAITDLAFGSLIQADGIDVGAVLVDAARALRSPGSQGEMRIPAMRKSSRTVRPTSSLNHVHQSGRRRTFRFPCALGPGSRQARRDHQ